MEHVDATVITTSLPMIARDLGVTPIVLKLGLTSYLVSLAVFIPVSGWLTDRFGGRVVFCSAIAMFMVSSMLCGTAHSFGFFVAARFMQGIGGAMMVPVGRIVIVRTVSGTSWCWRSTTSQFQLCLARWRGRRWAALSPPIGIGAGSSSSTFRSASWAFF